MEYVGNLWFVFFNRVKDVVYESAITFKNVSADTRENPSQLAMKGAAIRHI